MGDLNDYSDKVLDEAGSIPNSQVLRVLRQGNATRANLWNVAEFVKERTDRYSAWYDLYKDCHDDGGKGILAVCVFK